eukprot:gnl/TRDRNA2_/TRDRNA2_105917_c1_seq1.p1 gnl/TRDRNA2_/TRDRNA2_105917_c1~~gnl/TRDRNA2_/TRDRNA2_105917_c1_seq1.p1  ORF type:complete len:587 (-),score=121.74 gnl/TRDRNA2_/TRDRNA2_105917_c1_seq1:44-1741(-)
MAGEAASLMGHFTFDEDYINNQRKIRENKRILNVQDGLVEAGKSLGQGLEGILDVFKKPVEGAQRSGLWGAVRGLGQGAAGTFVKPMSAIGKAFSDVGSGIAAQVSPDSQVMKRRRARLRIRLPRMLFTELGAIRPWSELEAEVLRQLGRRLTAGVEEIIQLTQGGNQRTVLLLFAKRLLLAEVKIPQPSDLTAGTGGASSSTGGAHPLCRRSSVAAYEPSTAPSSGARDGRRDSGYPSSSTGGVNAAAAASGSTGSPDRGDHAAGKGDANAPDDDLSGEQGQDLFEAIDDAALKLFSQALKPINTLVYGVQDIENKLIGKDPEADPVMDFAEPGRRARELIFENIRAVHITSENASAIELEDQSGRRVSLPLYAAPLGPAARQALAAGFKTALVHSDSIANWAELHAALRKEMHSRRDKDRQRGGCGLLGDGWGSGSGAGHRILEVFEVERRMISSNDWKTPFLPTDRESGYRWVDATGCRHPHLKFMPPHEEKTERERYAEEELPPCELDGLFQPTGGWTIDVHPGTDSEGWRYGLAWNSSTWDAKPGIFDAVRKRRWTRTYV